MKIMTFGRWFCVSLLCAGASVGLCADTPSEPWNLVTNGHFDGGEEMPADWSRSPKADDDAYSLRRDTAVAVSDPGYQGVAASALIERKGPSENGRPQRLEWYQDGIAVEGGSALFLIAFCRIEGAAGGSVSLDFDDGAGRQVGRAGFPIPERAYRWRVLSDRTWRIIDELVQVPQSATQLRVNLTAGDEPGRTWFDRVTLGVVDPKLRQLTQQKWHVWRLARKRFPTAGWSFFSAGEWNNAPDKFQTYANAGFSMVKIFGGEYRRAVAAGLEPLVRTGDPTAEFPAKIGYFMKDEPQRRRQMFDYGKAFARILREDQGGAIPLLNNWGGNYVGEVIALQHPCFVMRTEYVLLANGRTRPHLYGNLEDLRRAALAHNIGYMGWALVAEHGSPGRVQFRQASESDLYWQVYSIVAYGAKGIWYYRYKSSSGLLDAPDQPNASYHHVRTLNRELHHLWPIVKHLRSTGVFHLQADPQGQIEDTVHDTVTIYQEGDVPPITDFEGDRFLLGMFENMDDPSDTSVYVMLQNKRHAMDTDRMDPKLVATAQFRIADANLQGSRFDAQAAVWKPLEAPDAVCSLTLGGGEGVLLRFQAQPEVPLDQKDAPRSSQGNKGRRSRDGQSRDAIARWASSNMTRAVHYQITDPGTRWIKDPDIAVDSDGPLDASRALTPNVIKVDGGYRMYYAGWVSGPEVPAGSKYHGRIFSAFSRDGLNWRKDPGICIDNGGRWDTAKASEPCVIDLPDGRFRMFYEACDLQGRWRIASATSAASG